MRGVPTTATVDVVVGIATAVVVVVVVVVTTAGNKDGAGGGRGRGEVAGDAGCESSLPPPVAVEYVEVYEPSSSYSSDSDDVAEC